MINAAFDHFVSDVLILLNHRKQLFPQRQVSNWRNIALPLVLFFSQMHKEPLWLVSFSSRNELYRDNDFLQIACQSDQHILSGCDVGKLKLTFTVGCDSSDKLAILFVEKSHTQTI